MTYREKKYLTIRPLFNVNIAYKAKQRGFPRPDSGLGAVGGGALQEAPQVNFEEEKNYGNNVLFSKNPPLEILGAAFSFKISLLFCFDRL